MKRVKAFGFINERTAVNMETVRLLNYVIAILFFACYSYQFVYILVSLFKGKKTGNSYKLHNYAVLIAARNEEAVIENLIESIKEQIYPSEYITVFVVADNCTDNTAAVAEKAGAVVYRRQNKNQVGKGYALDFLLERINEDYPDDTFDGYFVFDADNLLEPDYIYEMNRVFSSGYNIVTGYRNSKNYSDNWISAGYALWFLRESQFLNRARYILGASAGVSGTGFMFSKEIIKKSGGWKYFTLTEDLEFTADNIIKGEKIGYCETAVLYDEQPVDFKQSVRQRMRWAKGYLQVLSKHGAGLVKSVFADGNFSAFDMIMSISPAFILSFAGLSVNVAGAFMSMDDAAALILTLLSLLESLANLYLTLFAIGAITTASEWHRIHAPVYKKVLYMFTFPLFMFTYVPISAAALFKKVEWKPITHTKARKLSEIRGAGE